MPTSIPLSIKRLNLRDNNITGNLSWTLFTAQNNNLASLDLSGNQVWKFSFLFLFCFLVLFCLFVRSLFW